MLTVRWISEDGVDTIYEADRVSSQRRLAPDGVDRGGRDVFIDRPTAGVLCLEHGSVYVMNDAGNTVSSFQKIEGDKSTVIPQAA